MWRSLKFFPVHSLSNISIHCRKNTLVFFYLKSLTSELRYLYSDNDFKKCTSSKAILEMLHELGFLSAMSETVRLIQLFLTIPSTSVSNERSFSTLDRIRSFLRCTMAEDRLLSLARISIEKQMFKDLEQRNELHNMVIEKFAAKPRPLEFMLKWDDLPKNALDLQTRPFKGIYRRTLAVKWCSKKSYIQNLYEKNYKSIYVLLRNSTKVPRFEGFSYY